MLLAFFEGKPLKESAYQSAKRVDIRLKDINNSFLNKQAIFLIIKMVFATVIKMPNLILGNSLSEKEGKINSNENATLRYYFECYEFYIKDIDKSHYAVAYGYNAQRHTLVYLMMDEPQLSYIQADTLFSWWLKDLEYI